MEELYRRSAYFVATPGGIIGSGLAIGSSHFVTAKHVIDDARGSLSLHNDYINKRISPLTILGTHKDACLLQTSDHFPFYIPPLGAPFTSLDPDDQIICWASFSAIQVLRPLLISIGKIYGIHPFPPDVDFAVTIPTHYGCSGSGIVSLTQERTFGVISRSYGAVGEQIPLRERMISLCVDIFPLVQQFMPEQVAKGEEIKRVEYRWWSRDIILIVAGIAGGIFIWSIFQR